MGNNIEEWQLIVLQKTLVVQYGWSECKTKSVEQWTMDLGQIVEPLIARPSLYFIH